MLATPVSNKSMRLMLSPPSSPRQLAIEDEAALVAAAVSTCRRRTASMAFGDRSEAKIQISIESVEEIPQAASPVESPVVSACEPISSVEEPSTKRLKTCWDAVVRNPSLVLKRELEYMHYYTVGRNIAKISRSAPSSTPSPMSDSSTEGRHARRTRSELTSVTSEHELSPRLRASRTLPTPTSSCGSSSEGERKVFKPRKSPAPAQPRVHDLNYTDIEDCCPSTSLLPPGRSLRAEWKGAPMDLSNDPDVDKLHPAEVHLASVLRLPVEVYLDSKRRLFAEKVQRLRQGLAFRRTDSQKACRIDVNKASRLFGAFERVGWLEDSHFSHML